MLAPFYISLKLVYQFLLQVICTDAPEYTDQASISSVSADKETLDTNSLRSRESKFGGSSISSLAINNLRS
jgi:hypothetical protein